MALCASGWVLLTSELPRPAQTVPKAPGRCCGINPGAASCLGGQGSCRGTSWTGLQRPALVLPSGEKPWGRVDSPRDGTPFEGGRGGGGGHGSGAQLGPPWHRDPEPACWLPGGVRLAAHTRIKPPRGTAAALAGPSRGGQRPRGLRGDRGPPRGGTGTRVGGMSVLQPAGGSGVTPTPESPPWASKQRELGLLVRTGGCWWVSGPWGTRERARLVLAGSCCWRQVGAPSSGEEPRRFPWEIWDRGLPSGASPGAAFVSGAAPGSGFTANTEETERNRASVASL